MALQLLSPLPVCTAVMSATHKVHTPELAALIGAAETARKNGKVVDDGQMGNMYTETPAEIGTTLRAAALTAEAYSSLNMKQGKRLLWRVQRGFEMGDTPIPGTWDGL